jgi:hypothetical protein
MLEEAACRVDVGGPDLDLSLQTPVVRQTPLGRARDYIPSMPFFPSSSAEMRTEMGAIYTTTIGVHFEQAIPETN